MERALASHLIVASNLAYAIGEEGGLEGSPYYRAMGFVAPPVVIKAGPEDIHACFVGETSHGLVVAMQGTVSLDTHTFGSLRKAVVDWLHDMDGRLVEKEGIPGRVHEGFADAAGAIWEPMVEAIGSRLEQSEGSRLYLTGHSKGAAMALLAARRLSRTTEHTPSAVYVFGTPRIGDRAFADGYDRDVPTNYHFSNRDDVIPHIPSHTILRALLLLKVGLRPFISHLLAYVHTRNLVFISWDGTLVDTTRMSLARRIRLGTRRSLHITWLILTFRIGETLRDHHPDTGYLDSIEPDHPPRESR
jgi:hypothetical protein